MLLDEWPEDNLLTAIGDENHFAETAFLVPDRSAAADFELRWFTPTVEIRLCGHATLAAAHVLMARDDSLDMVRFSTRKAGILEVRRCETGCEVGMPAIPTEPGDWPEAVAALGAKPLEVWRNPDHYNLFLYDSEEVIRSIRPDFKALAALGIDSFAVTARSNDTDIVSRVFVPGCGVDEDSVTGSAHAVLTPFWADRLGHNEFTAYQASRRGGFVNCRLEGDIAWLGGSCVTIMEAEFLL